MKVFTPTISIICLYPVCVSDLADKWDNFSCESVEKRTNERAHKYVGIKSLSFLTPSQPISNFLEKVSVPMPST